MPQLFVVLVVDQYQKFLQLVSDLAQHKPSVQYCNSNVQSRKEGQGPDHQQIRKYQRVQVDRIAKIYCALLGLVHFFLDLFLTKEMGTTILRCFK
jgi:hypothetical protein